MKKFGRRDFINYLLGFGSISALASIFYPIGRYLIPPPIPEATPTSLKAGNIDSFPVNTFKIVRFGRKPLILIHDGEKKLEALSAVCTHLGCIVGFNKDRQQIICPCHNGIFSLTGKNISGPPPTPLKQYSTNVIKKEIIISEMKA